MRLVEYAKRQGAFPSDVMLDLVLENELDALFGVETSWSAAPDEHQELLKRDSVVFGLSDGGAHVAQIADSRYPTHTFSYWVRQRGMSMEWAVWMLTKKVADAFGIHDRGVLAPGLAADLVIFDPDAIADGPLERRNDFPAGARRIISVPTGVEHVIVNGTILRKDNVDQVEPGGSLPGKVLRSFRPHSVQPAEGAS